MTRLCGLALLVLLSVGCRADAPAHSGDPALDADVRVSPTPAAVGEARVFVVATDAGEPMAGGRVRVRGFAAGGEAPVSVEAGWMEAPSTTGGFGPAALDFPTAGRWWVEAEVTSGDGRTATVRHPLLVVRGN